jgi:hypothetical protein
MNLITLGKIAEKSFFVLLNSLEQRAEWFNMFIIDTSASEKILWQEK